MDDSTHSDIWDAILTHISSNDTVTIDDVDSGHSEEDVHHVLDYMAERDWLRQLNEDEWYIDRMGEQFQRNFSVDTDGDGLEE